MQTPEPMKRIDASLHTRGAAQFVDDVPPPAEMLHAAIVGAPVAHGKILSIDASEALGMKGVAAVLTAADIPGENQIGPIIADEPLLAEGTVHFMGQPVALVVATSPEAARRGAEHVRIEVEELGVIVDPREAFARGEGNPVEIRKQVNLITLP